MELLIGFLIALVIGLTGVGGGVLTAPVLILCLKLPAPQAVGTALVFVSAVKVLAVPVYVYRKQVSFGTLKYLAAGGVPAVVAGSLLMLRVSEHGLNWLVLLLIGLTVVLSASVSLYKTLSHHPRRETADRPRLLSMLAAGIGLEVGFSSAGAGALGTLALMQFTGLSSAQIVGTDLLFGFVLSVIGGGFHFAAGSYDAAILMKLIAGGLAGSVIGASLATVVPARALRLALSAWLVVVGCQLMCSAFSVSLW